MQHFRHIGALVWEEFLLKQTDTWTDRGSYRINNIDGVVKGQSTDILLLSFHEKFWKLFII